MRILPIIITRGHAWSRDGYTFLWQRGAITWTTRRENGVVAGYSDTSGVKCQVWIAQWVVRLATLPERAWRTVLARLWHDRLAFQYESGFASGLREGITRRDYYNQLTPEELEAVMAQPEASQEIK